METQSGATRSGISIWNGAKIINAIIKSKRDKELQRGLPKCKKDLTMIKFKELDTQGSHVI